MKRAQGRPVVTAFQDLCLGVPLSDGLLSCHLSVWSETQQKPDGNTKERQVLWVNFLKSDTSLLLKKLGILETHRRFNCYWSNQMSEKRNIHGGNHTVYRTVIRFL